MALVPVEQHSGEIDRAESRATSKLTIGWAYQELGLPEGAGQLRARFAFEKKAKELHPDKNATQEEKEAAHKKFIRVREAYGVIMEGEDTSAKGGLLLFVTPVAQGEDDALIPVELGMNATLGDLCSIIGRTAEISAQRVRVYMGTDILENSWNTPLADLGFSMEQIVRYEIGPIVNRYTFSDEEVDTAITVLEVEAAMGIHESADKLSAAVEVQLRRDRRVQEHADCRTVQDADRIGSSLVRNGFHAKAERFYLTGSTLASNPFEGAAMLLGAARCQRQQGKDSQAVRTCCGALQFAPDDSEILIERGLGLMALDRFREAEEDFSRARELCLKGGFVNGNLATAKIAAGFLHRARQFLESAEQMDVDHGREPPE